MTSSLSTGIYNYWNQAWLIMYEIKREWIRSRGIKILYSEIYGRLWKNQWLIEPLCRPCIETNIIWEPFTNKHKKMWDVKKASRAEAAIGKTKFRWMHLIIPCSRIVSRQRIQILRKNLNSRHWIVPLEDSLVE